MTNISASIVLYKTGQDARRTIVDFLDTKLSVHLYLLDNSPTTHLKNELADLIADKRIIYLYNNKNLGYGAGHNVAIKQILDSTDYHLVLNPDVSFEKGTLEKLVDFGEKNIDIGLLTPKVLYPDGSVQYVCKLLPTPFDLIFRRFLPASFTRKRMEKFELRQLNYNKLFQAPYIHGCFMFLRTEALKKVGLFDERFFMYPEDIDLTRRIHQHYKTVFYPEVVIVHAHAKASYKSLKLLWIHIVNMIKYFNKWGWIFDRERSRINKKILHQFDKEQ